MRKLIPLLLLLFCAFNVNAQEKTIAQKEVEQTVASFFDAISALDFDKMKIHTKDVQFVEYGEIWDLAVLVDRLKPMIGTGVKRTNTLKFVKTEVHENTAWVIYYNTADFLGKNDKKDHAEWLESIVMEKENSKWKITLLHSTHLPEKK